MVFAEVSAVPGILEVALAQKGALVRIFRHAISLFTVISAASRYLALLKQEISALWIFSSPSAFLETRPARCFVGSPIPRKTRSFRDSRIEKKKELRGNIIGPPFWKLFSFIFFIVTINISVGNGSRCILVNYSSFVADHPIEDRQQPVCEGIPGHGGREAREKVSIAFKISSKRIIFISDHRRIHLSS